MYVESMLVESDSRSPLGEQEQEEVEALGARLMAAFDQSGPAKLMTIRSMDHVTDRVADLRLNIVSVGENDMASEDTIRASTEISRQNFESIVKDILSHADEWENDPG